MQKLPAYELLGELELLIVDGAGTSFDPGSKIPTHAFQAAFEAYKLSVSLELIRKYKGMSKRTEIEKLLEEPNVVSQFEKEYERKPTMNDIDTIHAKFKELLYSKAAETEEIPGVRAALRRLKEEMNKKIMLTTGYNGEMIKKTIRKLPWLKEVLHGYITSDIDELFGDGDVYMESYKEGRPYPYMIFRAMELAEVKSADSVVKVDDTLVGLQAADNGHIPGIGVLSGNITDRAVYKQNLDRKHLVLQSLVQVVNLIEANCLNDVIIKQSI